MHNTVEERAGLGSPRRQGGSSCHENIRDFLATVPAERQHRLRYGDLVRAPVETVRELSRFVEIDPSEEMLRPYDASAGRMTGGLGPESWMTGDPKLHKYSTIDAPPTPIAGRPRFSQRADLGAR